MKMNRSILFISACLVAGTLNGQNTETELPERVIHIDYNGVKGPLNTMFNECVGAGRANEGLRADWQQLTYVKNECGFRYIRMHGLLTDDMGVYKEDRNGNPQYNYMFIDVLFDFLLGIDMLSVKKPDGIYTKSIAVVRQDSSY